MKLQVILAAVLFTAGAALGWALRPVGKAVQQVVQNPQTAVWQAIVGDLTHRLQAKDDAIAAASRRVLALGKAYGDSLATLKRREHDDSVQMAAATTPRDSAARCSVVLVDCERRAALSERRAADLQAQLQAQVTVGSRRCGVMAGVIPLRIDLPFKPRVGASVGILAGCQIL